MHSELVAQTLSHRFGHEIVDGLASSGVRRFEFAVAWARLAGVLHIEEPLKRMLEDGGSVRGTIGVDLGATSHEALEALLRLGEAGDAKFWIYHDESASSIFHPKLYLIERSDTVQIVAGSNNLTQAALFTNTEVSLSVAVATDHPLAITTRAVIAAWRDDARVSRELSSAFLLSLKAERYVRTEMEIAADRASDTQRLRGNNRGKRVPLFGTLGEKAPRAVATPHASPAARSSRSRVSKPTRSVAPSSEGDVLLIRVRRASETGRRTQVQIPQKVLDSPFFRGARAMKSLASGVSHPIRIARSRGSVNTRKIEIPEIDRVSDPILRVVHSGTELVYRVFDALSADGAVLHDRLLSGLKTGKTGTTMPAAPGRATLWRVI